MAAMPFFLCQKDKIWPIRTSVSEIVQPMSNLRFSVASLSTRCFCCNNTTSCTILTLVCPDKACCGYMSLCSFCNTKRGKYMVTIWPYKNWRNWCNRGLCSQHPQLTLMLSGYVRSSFSLYELVRFVPFSVTATALRACLLRKWVPSIFRLTAKSVGILTFIWHSSVILKWVSC